MGKVKHSIDILNLTIEEARYRVDGGVNVSCRNISGPLDQFFERTRPGFLRLVETESQIIRKESIEILSKIPDQWITTQDFWMIFF